MRAFSRCGSVVLLTLAACGSPAPRSRAEDQTRTVAPIPACVLQLPARRTESAGTLRKLSDDEVVKLMFPAYDAENRTLGEGVVACTGASVFSDPLLQGSRLVGGKTWPLTPQDTDLSYGSGGDRVKVAWLRTHEWDDRTQGGPLAVIRSGERFAELFAIGVLRGSAERTRLGTARLGTDVVVTAETDGCREKQGQSCESTTSIFLPRRGSLVRIADVPSERVALSARAERGTTGALEVRLSTAIAFKDRSIRLSEQVRIRDDAGREIRKAEHERILSVDDAGNVTANEPSLWDDVVKGEAGKR